MPFPYKRILCPVDLDGNSAAALKEGAILALSCAAKLCVLHVVQINPLVNQGIFEGADPAGLYETQTELARSQVEQMLSTIPPTVQRAVMIEIGEPGDVIIGVQSKLEADLIVMATHGRKGLKHLVLGSVAERVVRESGVPVLTVRSA